MIRDKKMFNFFLLLMLLYYKNYAFVRNGKEHIRLYTKYQIFILDVFNDTGTKIEWIGLPLSILSTS